VVEIEVRKAEAGSEKSTTLDINDIISKISEFAARIKEMSGDGKPMAVRLDGFNFSVARTPDMYDLTVKLNLTLKPKTPPTQVEVRVTPAPAA
jgi:hypothetical protein